MARIGLEMPRSRVARTPAEAALALDEVGLPAIIRPSYTLGGWGGGVAHNREEFEEIVRGGLDASPTTEVLIEENGALLEKRIFSYVPSDPISPDPVAGEGGVWTIDNGVRPRNQLARESTNPSRTNSVAATMPFATPPRARTAIVVGGGRGPGDGPRPGGRRPGRPVGLGRRRVTAHGPYHHG